MDYTQTPRYQKYIQKLQAMTPDQKAVLNSVMGDESMANDEIRKQIQGMQMAANKKSQTENIGLRRKATDAITALSREELDYSRGQSRTAEGLGLLNLGASTALGYKRMGLEGQLAEADRKRAAYLNSLIRR